MAYALLRFAHYGLLLGLFGATAFRSFGVRQSLGKIENAPMGMAMSVGAVAAPVVSVVLMLVSISVMMAQPVSQLEWGTVTAIVTTTHLGWAFLARIGFLVAAAVMLLTCARSASAIAIAAFWFGLAIATLAWSGHAAAHEGFLGLAHRLNDAIHLLAAGLWIGAIGWFLHLTIAAHRTQNTPAATLLADMQKFTPLGVLLVAIVAATGVANAQLIYGIENSISVIQTNYGQLLAVKVLLVGMMLFFAVRNAWLSRRQASFGDSMTDLAKLRVSLGGELVTAILVLGLVASIGMISPMAD